jgi:hypothetical protein
MDAQLKAKWVEALRSGKYRQTTGNLREERTTRRYGYCCLGVLCHVAGSKWRHGVPVLGETIMEAQGEAYLSYDALKLTGLDDTQQRVLADKNDEGSSFAEIADYIESSL